MTSGRQSFDLSVDRSNEEDYELIQLGDDVTRLAVEQSPDEAFLHFDEAVADGYSTFEYGAWNLQGRTGDIYLENESSTGNLILVYSKQVDPERSGDTGKTDSVNSGNNSGGTTFNQTNLTGDVQYVQLLLAAETLTSFEIRDSGGSPVWGPVTLDQGQSLTLPTERRVPPGGSIFIDGGAVADSDASVIYRYQ